MVEEDWLFGQYLARFSSTYRNVVTQEMISEALEIQKENDDNGNHIKIGKIFMEEFGVFLTEHDLDKAIDDFEKFRDTYMR